MARSCLPLALLLIFFTHLLTPSLATQPHTYRTQFPPAAPAPPRAFNPIPICAVTTQASAGTHIGVFDCDPLEDAAQLFVWTEGGSMLALASAPSLCLTVGKDKDPDAGTPSIELQPCAAGEADQVFAYNTSSKHMVHVASGQCLDLDETDLRVELYSCNEPPSPNQQWVPPTAAGPAHILSVANQQCMATCAPVNPGTLGDITNLTQHGDTVLIQAGPAAVSVRFYRPDILRVWLAPLGAFADPTHGELVLGSDFSFPPATVTEQPEWYDIASARLHLRAHKSPLRFVLYDSDGILLWSEAAPLTWNTSSTWQTLEDSADEHFYGCGMQNGVFAHRGSAVLIEQGGGWDAGGRPNPAPFYMSSQGYGVLRNTYAIGLYTFLSPTVLRHDEFRFDAFYFHGPSLQQILEAYTAVGGRPFMPPIWGLQLGDSDCYNSKNRNTSDVLGVADNYTAYDMPAGWFIPNDGYGCGYTELQEVGQALRMRGFQMALWTSTGLGNATWEIGQAGSRGIKTDVGWVGAGYRFALNAVKLATSLLETYGDSRRFVWTVCGWASTQAFAVMWNGDNYGTYEFIRFQIPTVIGSGLSGQAHTSGDVDGIFGGAADTYVRDLQWKSFLTVAMTMSGWADYGKQPWTHGEPYTTYNRNALQWRMRLTPYLYTYSRLANLTGMPIARGMVLEFPTDPVTWDNTTQYQFMCGEWLLVAPVYENATTRDNIYLPAEEWIDFNTAEHIPGPVMLHNYDAPLYLIPVFVRAGAIIPLWPVMRHVFERLPDPLTLLAYPGRALRNTSFTLYEDDGVSRFFNTQHALQTFSLAVAADSITLAATASVGDYVGKPRARGFEPVVSLLSPPSTVTLGGLPLGRVYSMQDYEAAQQAWYYSPDRKACMVKTGSMSTAEGFVLVLQ